MLRALGIHHVTAIAGDPQRNVDFHAGILGLRLVKRTVNFDDPQTYHFYFGDEPGTPGTLLTFFPWPGAHRGRQGVGQVAAASFAIAPASLGFWIARLLGHGIAYRGPERRTIGGATEQVLSFADPDGLPMEFVATEGAARRASVAAVPSIPREHGIRGLHTVPLWVDRAGPTVRLLTETLGFRAMPGGESVQRLAAGEGGSGALVDVREVGGFLSSAEGVGTLHHVAWRVADEVAQLELRERVIGEGLRPTDVYDRKYFRSVYFREPGGILFELATDGPGMLIDESLERLGRALMLPERYESMRESIERILPVVHVPAGAADAEPFDRVAEASEESFPASDAPGWTSIRLA